jgi:lysozyme family protein
MTQEECFREVLARWEGGLSLDPADRGNWFAAPGCAPELVGSCHGVTAAVLARFRGCAAIGRAEMAALTLDEAVRVGVRFFYREPGFDRLPWDATVASVVDFGWGAGPGVAVARLQAMVGAVADGCLGPATATAYRAHVAAHGLAAAANGWRDVRDRFYGALVRARPADNRFLAGWQRRSAYFLPGTPWWWRFTGAA